MKTNPLLGSMGLRQIALVIVVAAMSVAAVAEDELDHALATVNAQRLTQCEADLCAELDALAARRIGPILLTEERFTRKLPDGSVQVSQYWGRAPMQAYAFFDAYDLLGRVLMPPVLVDNTRSASLQSAYATVVASHEPPLRGRALRPGAWDGTSGL